MSHLNCARNREQVNRGSRRFQLASWAACAEALEGRVLLSTVTVTSSADSGPGSLRAAIAAAAPGDTIVFAHSVNSITLTSGELPVAKDLSIQGPGAARLTLSGNANSRIFDLGGSANLSLAGMTLTDGLAPAGGAILQNTTGSLTVNNCAFTNNQALDNGTGAGIGGAIESAQGVLTITGCTFSGNKAVATSINASFGYVTGDGGAVDIDINNSSPAVISDSTFNRNQALTVAQSPGVADGGAVSVIGPAPSTLTISGCAFNNNAAIGSGGGQGSGGAVEVDGNTTVSNSSFSGNLASGGSGGGGAGGGALVETYGNQPPYTLTVTGCTIAGNTAAGAPGGDGVNTSGSCSGGGIANGSGTIGSLIVRDSTITNNRAIGAPLAPTANPPQTPATAENVSCDGGGIYCLGPLTVTGSTISHNEVVGASGTTNYPGAPVYGGGIDIALAAGTVTDSIIDDNRAIGGAGGTGTAGADGIGGGVDLVGAASLTLTDTLVSGNQAMGGAGGAGAKGGDGFGGGINVGGLVPIGVVFTGNTLNLDNCLLYGNQALGGTAGLGSMGGNGLGGGVSVLGGSSASSTRTALIANTAAGGDGANRPAASSGGDGSGGGVYVGPTFSGTAASATFSDSLIAFNDAEGGQGTDGGADGLGIGGGTYDLGTLTEDALTQVFGNHASTSNDNMGP